MHLAFVHFQDVTIALQQVLVAQPVRQLFKKSQDYLRLFFCYPDGCIENKEFLPSHHFV